ETLTVTVHNSPPRTSGTSIAEETGTSTDWWSGSSSTQVSSFSIQGLNHKQAFKEISAKCCGANGYNTVADFWCLRGSDAFLIARLPIMMRISGMLNPWPRLGNVGSSDWRKGESSGLAALSIRERVVDKNLAPRVGDLRHDSSSEHEPVLRELGPHQDVEYYSIGARDRYLLPSATEITANFRRSGSRPCSIATTTSSAAASPATPPQYATASSTREHKWTAVLSDRYRRIVARLTRLKAWSSWGFSSPVAPPSEKRTGDHDAVDPPPRGTPAEIRHQAFQRLQRFAKLHPAG
ncbi:unnamed protein product, partial [Amoebophrya sp. A120]